MWESPEVDSARGVDYLTDLEKDLILEVNKVRTDPGRYAEEFVKPRLQFFLDETHYQEPGKQMRILRQGKPAVDECYNVLMETQPLAPLVPKKGLHLAAADHAKDLGAAGLFGHIGSGGSLPRARISKYGDVGIGVTMENISAGDDTAKGYVVRWLIDDRTPDRGHRVAILTPEVKFIGSAVAPHKRFTRMPVMEFVETFDEKSESEIEEQQQPPPSVRQPVTVRSGDYTPGPEWDSPAIDPARSFDYLTDVEKDIIQEVNKVRSDPARYAEEYIKPRLEWFLDDLRYQEPGKEVRECRQGKPAVEECYDVLKATDPLGVLEPAKGLHYAAGDHVRDQNACGRFGHTGSSGSLPRARISRYGDVGTSVTMENIAAGEDTGRGYVVRWLIDDRTPSRGHRLAILSPEVRVIGVAVGPHKKLNAMSVVVFAESFFEREDAEPGWAAARPASIAAKSGADAKPTSSRVSAWDSPDLDSARLVEFLSDVEKEIILEVNKARTDPGRFADEYIKPRLGWFVDDKKYRDPNGDLRITREGKAAVQEAYDALKDCGKLVPLVPSRGLTLGAEDHLKDQDKSGRFGHQGSDGSFPRGRLSRYGHVGLGVTMECIAAGADTGLGYVVRWLIDDGTKGRGHRTNILAPDARFAGVAVGPHSKKEQEAVLDMSAEYKEDEEAQKHPGGTGGAPPPAPAKPAPQASREPTWQVSPDIDSARSVAYLSDNEKDMIREVNKVRTDPSRFADDYIKPRLAWFISETNYMEPTKGEMESTEGPAAVRECYDLLKATSPLPPLAPMQGLCKACSDHVKDQDRANTFSHAGSDGSQHRDRANRYGRVGGTSVENIAAGNDTGRNFVCRWLIDDGTPSRGHRKNLLHAQVKFIGGAIGPHQSWGEMAVMVSAGDYDEK